MLLECIRLRGYPYINCSRRELFAPAALTNNVPGYAVKVIRGLAPVTVFDVGQAKYHAINRFIGEILSIVQAFADKNSHQARMDSLVLIARDVSIRI